MSFALLSVPAETALPIIRPLLTAFGAAVFALRPLVGYGLLAAILWVFKPLLSGAARAAVILFKPRQSLTERNERRTLRSIVALNRMARELDTQQPNLAAELRLLAARG
ncbi:MAG: hypothetical protein H7244_10475 [Herminiimonas sp.]|nr:hypothetical protein [Herminiimonas sp.]